MFQGKKFEVHSVKTEDQLADLWTKSLSKDLFEKFTYEMGFSIAQANKRVIAKQHETRKCEISRLNTGIISLLFRARTTSQMSRTESFRE